MRESRSYGTVGGVVRLRAGRPYPGLSSARLVRDSAVPEFFGGSKSKDSAAEPTESNDVMR